MIELFAAVERGDAKKVDELLAQLPVVEGVVPKMGDYRRRTAMHLAVEHGHKDVVEVLLGNNHHHQRGVDLSAKDCSGFTALHLACELGHDKIVERLLKEAGPKTTGQALAFERSSNDELTCLHLAAIRGHVSVVKALLATTPALAIMEDKQKRSPLHFAVEYGHTEIAALLMESVRSQVEAGDDAMFHAAIKAGHDNIVGQLLDHRPQLIDVVDSDGQTPLCLAAECGRGSIVEQLFARRQPRLAEVGGDYQLSLLHFAVQFGCDMILGELLVEKPHLVDLVCDYDRTVLHFAVRHGHEGIVEQLLAHKPTLIDAKDKDGMLPLHVAAIKGHEKVVEQLVAHRPDLMDAVDNQEFAALRLACLHTRPKVVASLLARGAVASGEMLWDAFEGGEDESKISEVVKLLCAHNPELMGMPENGAMMLHRVFDLRGVGASWRFFSKELMTTVWQLSPAHVLHATDDDNDTPPHVAIRCYNDFAIELLQWKLSLDEILEGFAKFNKKCPPSILDILREPLLESLDRDTAATVWKYFGLEWLNQRPRKKMRVEN